MGSFQVFLVILALTVVFGGALTPKQPPEVLSEINDPASSPSAEPSITPTSTPRPSPTVTPQPITQNTPMLVFPGAKITQQTSDQTILVVEANPNDVANWYRAELNKLGIRAIASSQNNTNGNFLAKISASAGGMQYEIEIRRPAGENNVTIILN